MTNWMTAAGIALIAGGLATLISFRSVLFGGGGGQRRPGRRQRRALEAPQRRPALAATSDPVPPVVPAQAAPLEDVEVLAGPAPEEAEFEAVAAPRRRGRRGRRRALAAPGGQPSAQQPGLPDRDEGFFGDEGFFREEVDERGGLASIGFANADEDGYEPEAEVVAAPEAEPDVEAALDEDVLADEVVTDPVIHPAAPRSSPAVEVLDEEEPEPPAAATAVDRTGRGYGDRVEGWVRPEYQNPPGKPRAGEYWTPIPVDLAGDAEPSAKGFGWPMPVERLPAVPDYEPATGFDLAPVTSEPTEAVQIWGEPGEERAGRIRLPRSWSNRNEKIEMTQDTRRRPRPRPRPTAEPVVENRTVYVSRHAADPPQG